MIDEYSPWMGIPDPRIGEEITPVCETIQTQSGERTIIE